MKMEKIDKVVRVVELYRLYKNLLPASQQEILYSYYFLDLSLSEIAIDKGVSRSAVEDAISKGNKKLEELEEKMHLAEKNSKISEKINDLQEKSLNMSEIESLEDIKKELY